MPCVSGCPCQAGVIARRLREAGFTLLEILVVMAIIAVLFTVSFRLIRGAKERTALARARSELAVLANALEEFRRLHGDYPQTAAAAAETASPQLLFAALTGRCGPLGSAGGQIRGPVLVEISKFALEHTGRSDADGSAENAFLDPWGTPYLYIYKTVGASATEWTMSAPMLFSAGPDGRVAAWPSRAGVFSGESRWAGANADNVYADQL